MCSIHNLKAALLKFQHFVTRPRVFTVNHIMYRLSFAISILTQIADREACVTGNELQFALEHFEVIWMENDVTPALNCAPLKVL